jgi:alpha-beta hydrolase superfamily lysophospholipase
MTTPLSLQLVNPPDARPKSPAYRVVVGLCANRRTKGKVMPEAEVNGIKLYYELHGSGDALALVHGSWVDATAWRFVLAGLAESFRVLTYDRRGHSRSERPATQGSFDEDGDDLAALLEALDLAPAT